MTLTTLPASLGSSSFQSKDNQSQSSYTSTPETALLNLTRLVARLERNLLTPSPATAENIHALRKDALRRGRVSANVTYAQTHLSTLEKSLPSIKPVSRRHEIQTEVARLRGVLRKLGVVIEDASSVDEDEDEDEDDESGEDLLDTPEGEEEEEIEAENELSRPSDLDIHATMIPPTKTMETAPAIPTATEPPTPEPTSTLRNRHHHHTSSSHPPTATTTTPPNTNANLPTSEKTLTTHLHEQETLTTSLLSLATQLKTSSQTFQSSLESEKSILNRAVSDLDRTSSNMDSAERRMGMLRRMTEGKGWWGRMMLYAWIVAGWLLAVGIVFLGPKIRF